MPSRVYLDICCLKRPFDLQVDPVVRLQTEAILSLLALEGNDVEFIRSTAMMLENSLNPVHDRREAVDAWLSLGARDVLNDLVEGRIEELVALGFKSFDAFHIASAELSQASAFVTVDSRLLRNAARHDADINVRVVDPIRLLEELWQPKT